MPTAIISIRVRLEQPLDQALETLRRGAGVSVELDDERRARLDPTDPRSEGFARVLDGLGSQRLPAYLEIDSDTEALTRLLIPTVARVARIDYDAEGAFRVTLDASHAVHRLRLDNPDFAQLERELRGALRGSEPVIVVGDDSHQIIGVRTLTPDDLDTLGRLLPPFPLTPIPDLDWLARLRRWIRWWLLWPWWFWFECVSRESAQQAFDSVAVTTCDPLRVPPPCIPFRYPDDGCFARAHEMCRLMINSGLSPRKVWIDCSPQNLLHVNTRNNPHCFVEWTFHVAPTLCVRERIGFPFFRFPFTQRMVIDPALFTAPVTEATWKGVQRDPNAVLTRTSADEYWHGGYGPDPMYTSTNEWLALLRLSLQLRSIQEGSPPYAACP
jgi:glutaminase-like protein